MKRYIIHIGMHKTGTSSLQAFLSNNRLSLLEQGIDFPAIGREPKGSQAHRHIAAWFRRQKKEYPEDFGRRMPGGISDAETVLLSSEDFYFCLPDQIERMAAAFGSNVRIICYRREPASHVLSMYKEHLKTPMTSSFPEFIEQQRQAIETEGAYSYYAYDRNFATWARYFAITPADYRRDGIIADFLARCEIALYEDENAAAVWENTALPDAAALLLLAISRSHSEGIIDAETWRILKRRIAAAAAPHELPDIASHRRPVTVDMRAFLASFRAANRDSVKLAERSADEVTFMDTVNIDHVKLTSIAREHFAS